MRSPTLAALFALTMASAAASAEAQTTANPPMAAPALAPSSAAAPAAPANPAAAPTPVPAYPYAPAYPGPYAYPPAAPYPYPVYGYPGPPPGSVTYPGYPPRPAPPAVPPTPLPSGRWRVGAAMMLVPEGSLSYDLRYRGESLLTYNHGIKTTGGVSAFVEYDGIRYLHLGFAFQVLPSVEWSPMALSATTSNPFGGSARAFDFLPQVGARYAATPRLRLLAYAAPGYSIFTTSGMADMLASSGTARGFAVQAAAGVLYAIGEALFFSVRGSYQWGFENNQVHSNTTGESADVRFRLNFAALQASLGFWF